MCGHRLNLSARGSWCSGLRLLLLLLPTLAWGNLIENGGFEAGGLTTSAGFATHYFEGTYDFAINTLNPHSGRRCISISAPADGWARWYTTDVFVLEGARYRLSCWVRSECPEETAQPGDVWLIGSGINLQLPVGRGGEWTQVQGDCTATATGRVGLYLQSLGAGQVFFDDVALEMTAPPPPGGGEAAPTDGEALTAIVIPTDPAIHHLYLADEARCLVQEMTGRTLSIRTSGDRIDERCVYIGVTPEDDSSILAVGVRPRNPVGTAFAGATAMTSSRATRPV